MTSALTDAHRQALAHVALTPDRCQPLIDAGCDADTAVRVVLARHASNWAGSDVADSDVAFARASGDPALLLALVEHDTSTAQFLPVLAGDGPMTRSELEQCVRLGADPYYLYAYAHSGGAASVMLEALERVPSLTSHEAHSLLSAGAAVDDVAWIMTLGAPLNHSALRGTDGSLAGEDTPTRRLALLLIAAPGFSQLAAQTIAEFTAHEPWADTFCRLVADGDAPADALRAARADHTLETRQRLTVTAPAPTPAPAAGRGR